jgi:hypothetical protein
MSLFAWAEKAISGFNIWDIAIFKTYLFSLGIIVGAYISDFVKKKVWIFIIIVVLSGAWLVYKMFA